MTLKSDLLKHVKFDSAMEGLIILEVTIHWLVCENISGASKTLSYFCKVHIFLIKCPTVSLMLGLKDSEWGEKFVLYAEWNSKKWPD